LSKLAPTADSSFEVARPPTSLNTPDGCNSTTFVNPRSLSDRFQEVTESTGERSVILNQLRFHRPAMDEAGFIFERYVFIEREELAHPPIPQGARQIAA
jgi:hypothetical protein